jgi:hypothetical protein
MYLFVPVKVQLARKFKVPEPVIVILPGILAFEVQLQLSEAVIAQFPEPGTVQVSEVTAV